MSGKYRFIPQLSLEQLQADNLKACSGLYSIYRTIVNFISSDWPKAACLPGMCKVLKI